MALFQIFKNCDTGVERICVTLPTSETCESGFYTFTFARDWEVFYERLIFLYTNAGNPQVQILTNELWRSTAVLEVASNSQNVPQWAKCLRLTLIKQPITVHEIEQHSFEVEPLYTAVFKRQPQ